MTRIAAPRGPTFAPLPLDAWDADIALMAAPLPGGDAGSPALSRQRPGRYARP